MSTAALPTLMESARTLKTYALAFGDRFYGPARKLTGFDEAYGAGRLKTRMFTGAGMDSPWGQGSATVTLDDGEVYEVWMSGNGQATSVPTAVDAVKAVIWWYEPNTDSTSPAADITLEIRQHVPSGSGCTTSYNSRADLSYDTRKMVYLDGVGGDCLKLRITGVDVTANDELDNALVRHVGYFWMWEDNARNDSDGPPPCSSEFDPVNCVEQL